jgi:hypothetical protein
LSDIREAITGREVRVDYASIEQTLAELWRIEKTEGVAVTRAALWNVVAHASNARDHDEASDTLARAAAAVPQRTIVIRADPTAPAEMAAWISANCHLLGEGKQVCSEEISIVAGGDHVQRVPPLVSALLIPDMPVAFWWLGDLPHDHASYVHDLLESADRLIVDSSQFDSPTDLEIVEGVGKRTDTAAADLNWIRLDGWRAATASVFDPPQMRDRLGTLQQIRVLSGVSDASYFGESVQALLFASWLIAQAGLDIDGDGGVSGVEVLFEVRPSQPPGVARVDLELKESSAAIERDLERGVLVTNVDGRIDAPEAVTRTSARKTDQLIVRELQRPHGDPMLTKVLPIAIRMAKRLSRK